MYSSTHAKQCKDSMHFLHTHPSTYNVYKSQSPNSFSPGSTQPAWAHLRVLRDTGNTCHGSPDRGEGSSRDHTCTACPWKTKRKRQDYGCTYICGDSRGCPMSSGDKQAIRVTHRVHAELWTSCPQLVARTIPLATRMTTGLWEVGMGMVQSLDVHYVQY